MVPILGEMGKARSMGEIARSPPQVRNADERASVIPPRDGAPTRFGRDNIIRSNRRILEPAESTASAAGQMHRGSQTTGHSTGIDRRESSTLEGRRRSSSKSAPPSKLKKNIASGTVLEGFLFFIFLFLFFFLVSLFSFGLPRCVLCGL